MRYGRQHKKVIRATRAASQSAARHLQAVNRRLPTSQRARIRMLRAGQLNESQPFVPPEDWHEPSEPEVLQTRARSRQPGDYEIVVRSPGVGYRHVLTPDEVRARLAELPAQFLQNLEVVQFAQMTRKKQSFPCYGMQWGTALYLYPIEETFVERYVEAPKPAQLIEARMYGGQWISDGLGWSLHWTEQAIKDFYLHNILIHELGHLVDQRNSRSVDRERYAEWFAIEYGYRVLRRLRPELQPKNVQRHG